MLSVTATLTLGPNLSFACKGAFLLQKIRFDQREKSSVGPHVSDLLRK